MEAKNGGGWLFTGKERWRERKEGGVALKGSAERPSAVVLRLRAGRHDGSEELCVGVAETI